MSEHHRLNVNTGYSMGPPSTSSFFGFSGNNSKGYFNEPAVERKRKIREIDTEKRRKSREIDDDDESVLTHIYTRWLKPLIPSQQQ